MKPMFTPEELAELAAFDAEVDDEPLTQAEIEESRARDKEAKHDEKDKRSQKIAAGKRAYYAANKEKINAHQREYNMRRRRAKKEE